MEGIAWIPPKYKRREKLPFIPLEPKLDAKCKERGNLKFLEPRIMKLGLIMKLSTGSTSYELIKRTLEMATIAEENWCNL